MVVRTQVQIQNQWSPKTSFPSFKKVKVYYPKADSNRSPGVNYLTDNSCKLVDRYLVEIDRYFGKASDDEDRALPFMLHPMMAVQGFEVLLTLKNISGEDEQEVNELKTKFKEIVVSAVCQLYKKNQQERTMEGLVDNNVPREGRSPPAAAEQQEGAVEGSVDSVSSREGRSPPTAAGAPDDASAADDDDEEEDDDDVFATTTKRQKTLSVQQETNSHDSVDNSQLKEEIEELVKKYVEFLADDMDWGQMVQHFPTKVYFEYMEYMKGTQDAAEWNKWVETKSILKLWKHFDVLSWWKVVGKEKFSKLYTLACVVLGMPPSNASQERYFSHASWFDGKLMQSQKDTRLEMRSIDALNREAVADMKQSLELHNNLAKSSEEKRKLHMDALKHLEAGVSTSPVNSEVDDDDDVVSYNSLDYSDSVDDDKCLESENDWLA